MNLNFSSCVIKLLLMIKCAYNTFIYINLKKSMKIISIFLFSGIVTISSDKLGSALNCWDYLSFVGMRAIMKVKNVVKKHHLSLLKNYKSL